MKDPWSVRPKNMRQYSFKGLAGCVTQTKSRRTGTLVGIYHGLQSGLEADPECPWVTVCEAHGCLVSHGSLRLAKMSAPAPDDWCEDCRKPTEGHND